MNQVAGSLRDLDFDDNYATSGYSLLRGFYAPALDRAASYDRAAGYFSSAVLALAPAVLSRFIERGGKIRLLCSPNLSEVDAAAILNLPAARRPTTLEVAAASVAALGSGSRLEERAVACLRALLDSGALEIRFVTVDGSGLFHEKTGVFTDAAGNRVSFNGSANETAAAWSGFGNHESIEVFPEWAGESEARRCARHAEQFDETWHGLRRGLTVTSAEDAAGVIRARTESEPLEDIIADLRRVLAVAEASPATIDLRKYQEEVLLDWERHGYRGVISFATGGGKTRTAVEAIRRWTHSGRPALVLVPTSLLHRQWAQELARLLHDPAVLLAGAGHDRSHWARLLADYTRADEELGPRIVLATYRTAATPLFRELVQSGHHLMVVGDEVHTAGAPDTRSVLRDIAASATLGLSATPERFGDPVGTALLTDYFGAVLEPRFGLGEALEASVLVPYDYSFRTCTLSDEESEQWRAFSERVAREMARNDGEMTERALQILRQRALISKRARAKALIARDVISGEYSPGDRWLIYCGDVGHLKEVRAELEGLGLDLLEYHSKHEGDAEATLEFFEHRGGVLLAVKCLDEGVDIPLINRALILASSTNPREYIQRRGRVLRKSPGKYSSRIFDVIVIDGDGRAITPSEVKRAIEFAEHARNVGPAIYLRDLLPVGMNDFGFDFEDDTEDMEGGQ